MYMPGNSNFDAFHPCASLLPPHIRVSCRRRCNPCRPHTRRTKASSAFFRYCSRTNRIGRCIFVELRDFWSFYHFKGKFLFIPCGWIALFTRTKHRHAFPFAHLTPPPQHGLATSPLTLRKTLTFPEKPCVLDQIQTLLIQHQMPS